MKGSRNPPLPEHHRVHARELRHDQTDAERRLWQKLRAKQLGGYKFRRQYPVAGYVLDFYCHELRLAIELDGSQHMAAVAKDAERTAALAGQGIKVLRFWNNQVLVETEAVLVVIWQVIGAVQDSPHPSPLPVGEGGE